MSQKHYSAIVGLAVVFGLMLGGCEQQKFNTAKVHGKITYQGKPVTTGRITFYPIDGSRPAMAAINEDGTYTLATAPGAKNDGALLGKHKVTIKSTRTVGGAPMDEFGKQAPDAVPAEPPKLEWLVPEKYSRKDTSGLTAEVKEGDNPIDFNLP